MPVESLFPRLEPLLAQVSKPIQYVGGELNSTVKDWDACDVRWALEYPDAYEVGVPNQGVMILYEVLNEAEGVLAERTYAVWPDMEALMREHAVPAFTVDAHRPVGAFDVLGRLVRHRARLHQHAADAGPRRHPAARGRPHRGAPAGHRRRALGVQPRAGGRLHRRRGARRRRAGGAGDQRGHPRPGRPRAAPRPAAGASCCCGWRAPAGSTSRRSTTSSTCPTAGSSGSRPTRAGVPWRVSKHTVMDLDEWPYPKTAAGAAGRVGARAGVGRDLPRLHPRLPLLPGRHDHPPGARAVDHRRRRDGRAGAGQPPASRRSGCCRCPAPTTARSRR